jgi:hypothetical protein
MPIAAAQLPPYRLLHAELFRDKAAAALPHSKGFASEYIQFTVFYEISCLDPKSVFINNFR